MLNCKTIYIVMTVLIITKSDCLVNVNFSIEIDLCQSSITLYISIYILFVLAVINGNVYAY